MLGKARLEVPATDNCDAIREDGLSDALAMSYGRLFGLLLSDEHEFVFVTLSDGVVKVIGHDTLTDELVFGRLVMEC